MPWTVAAPSAELAAVRLDLTGVVSAVDVEAAFRETLGLCVHHDVWLVLADATAMTAAHSIIDIYEMLTAIADLGVQDRFREALVCPTDPVAYDRVRFWEDAAVNRGLACAAFLTEDAAVAWLLP